jgi:DnaK suppressor protein
MLEERRHVLRAELQGKIRDVRADGSDKLHYVLDEVESSENDSQEALELALIQMKSETLDKVTEALSRLENGSYGYCFECGGEVAEARLRALPFASRCRDCEEAREEEQLRERARQRRPLGPLGFALRGPAQ